MSFRIITNSFYDKAGHVVMTTDVTYDEYDNEKVLNITDGPRHLSWDINGVGNRRLLYKSIDAPQSYDSVVIVNADLHNTRDVSIRDVDNIGNNTRFSTASFAETLLGPTSKDWIYFTDTPHENIEQIELRLASTYTKKLHQVYAGLSVLVHQVTGYIRQPLNRNTKFFIGRQLYQVQERITISVEGISDATLDQISTLPRLFKSPCFIYDADGEWFSEKLFHVVLETKPVAKRFDDMNQVDFSFLVLRYER